MWVGLAALVVVGGIWPVQTVLVVCILGIVVGIWRLFRPGVRR
jgi:membrane protein implicated in regulation of membrane protease activity